MKGIGLVLFSCVASCYARAVLPDSINAVFFANWAQYRDSPYQFYPSNLTSILDDIDILYYGFAYFCPPNDTFQPYWVTDPDLLYCVNKSAFEVIPVEGKDPVFYQEIISLREASSNAAFKLVLSIGGWNFPSNYFSLMTRTNETRQIFINSVVNYLNKYNLDGVDIDWEYPASKPRMDSVEMWCDDDARNPPTVFHNVSDYGGTYNDSSIDRNNFVLLMKEMRSAFDSSTQTEDYLITFCGQAGLENVRNGFDIEQLVKYVDLINIMTYDFTVSATGDVNESLYTAPNEPLYQPKSASGNSIDHIAVWNINSTINGYLEMGAPSNQLLVGIAYYGHTWYIPGLATNDASSWAMYGIESTKPGSMSNCCSVYTKGYGGSAGLYTLQCGFNGYYEISNAGFPAVAQFDNVTMTYISYLDTSMDGWTPADTWINYQGVESIKAIVNFGRKNNLRGAFGFDVTIDSYDNAWTFELTQQMFTCVRNGC